MWQVSCWLALRCPVAAYLRDNKGFHFIRKFRFKMRINSKRNDLLRGYCFYSTDCQNARLSRFTWQFKPMKQAFRDKGRLRAFIDLCSGNNPSTVRTLNYYPGGTKNNTSACCKILGGTTIKPLNTIEQIRAKTLEWRSCCVYHLPRRYNSSLTWLTILAPGSQRYRIVVDRIVEELCLDWHSLHRNLDLHSLELWALKQWRHLLH